MAAVAATNKYSMRSVCAYFVLAFVCSLCFAQIVEQLYLALCVFVGICRTQNVITWFLNNLIELKGMHRNVKRIKSPQQRSKKNCNVSIKK